MRRTQEQNYDHISLSANSFFSHLDKDEISRLDLEKECYAYKRGTVIYQEGSRLTGFYSVVRGILKIYKTGIDGKEQILRFAKSGDIIAYRSLLSQEPACTTAKVIEDALLCYIPYKTMVWMLESNTKFSLSLLQKMAAELKEANNYMTDIAQKTVRERAAEILLILKNNFDVDKDNVLQISITREELANMVGTATESIIRLLSEFKQDKLIELQGRKIKIIDIKGLQKRANI